MPVRVLTALGLVVVGAVTGIATVALHDLVWGIGLGLAATTATAVALPPGWSTRLPFAVGWVVLVVWLTLPRSEGDYLISQDWQGYTVLGVAVVLMIVAIGTLPRPRRATTDDP